MNSLAYHVVQKNGAMSRFVHNKNLRNTFPYVDNVTIAGKIQEEHDFNAQAFPKAINRNNFTLNETKTIILVSNIRILSYVVGNGLIKLDLDP